MDNKKIVLSVNNIKKSFGSVVALENVSFDIYKEEIVGLVGDNGAGKSTLIKIISGNFPPDSGEIFLEGKKVNFKSPIEARRLGIETVYQDLSLCGNLSSAANLYIGREICKNIIGLKLIQKKAMDKNTEEIMNKISITIPSVKEKVDFLSGGQRQAVALGRFVGWSERLSLLDEPTAALGINETKKVLQLINEIRREKKIAIIFISHNLEQLYKVVDRIIVLRHGEVAGIREKNKTDPDEIVSLITGAALIGNSWNKEGE